MKKLSYLLVTMFIIITSIAATLVYEPKNATAEVEQIQGFYVFTDSKPVKDFEYIGTVKSSITLTGQYEPVRNKLLQKARKEFPQADGIILHLVNGGVDKADCIKFK